MTGTVGTAPTLATERLVLRPWRTEDLEPFAALNADLETMQYFPAPLSRVESDRLVERMTSSFATQGIGMWALEAPGEAAFVGTVGLLPVGFEAAFVPATEIGWRLSRRVWGRGYATEAARAALRHAFDHLELAEVISFTAAVNRPSRAVMERLGMRRDPAEDFAHPRVPFDHRLQPHVLYRINRTDPDPTP